MIRVTCRLQLCCSDSFYATGGNLWESPMSSRLERLILLDQELRRGLYPSVERLCRLLEVQPRTLFQDLKDLRERLGLDIVFDRTRGGYYNASPEKTLPTFSLTDQELFSVILGAALIRPELDRDGQNVIGSAILKLCAASTADFANSPDLILDRVSPPKPLEGVSNNLDLLYRLFAASCANRQIAITVDGADGEIVTPSRIMRSADSAWSVLVKYQDGVEMSISLSGRDVHARTIK